MTLEQEVQEAFDAANALADEGHDASEAWERHERLHTQWAAEQEAASHTPAENEGSR